jgi:hypothetical protein
LPAKKDKYVVDFGCGALACDFARSLIPFKGGSAGKTTGRRRQRHSAWVAANSQDRRDFERLKPLDHSFVNGTLVVNTQECDFE